jgi:EAL domain-containing protein (putative c-di-GMP-specific phosphodiesterase class I)/CheY-like chemotaxis protein
MMPEMDGLTAAGLIKQNALTERIPIIILTGQNERNDRIRAFDSGALDFIAKPFNVHELLAHVRSYLNYSELNRKYVSSTRDPDTQLPNRAALKEAFFDVMDGKLLLIRVDGLDDVFKSYGDEEGVRLTIWFADLLRNRCRRWALGKLRLFHIGKDLFALLADGVDADEEGLRALFEQIQSLFETSLSRSQVNFTLSVSGAAVLSGPDKLRMGENALMAMNGSSRDFTVADEVTGLLQEKIAQNLYWLKQIKDGLREERFIPYFQPIFNLENNTVDRYEALIRYQDAKGGIHPPASFLKVALNSRYYPKLTLMMLKNVFKQFRRQKTRFSVNISVQDVDSQENRNTLLNIIASQGETAGRLTIEMIEQESFWHVPQLKSFIEELKAMGVSFAIDDFGAGYSNFRTLLELKVDYLKLDGSLIRFLDQERSSRDVVEMITRFAHSHGMALVAEFVESESILGILRELGVDFAQGYFIGKPAPLMP